jgi:uncharacterized protein (DUF58 family)
MHGYTPMFRRNRRPAADRLPHRGVDFDTSIFDEEFLRKIERLTLVSRRLRRSHMRGEHRTQRRGIGLDFADYRAYQPGDDFRYIDWNIFARLNRPFVKVFTADQNLELHLLVDTSSSMRFGRPPRLDYAKQLAAALAYLALHGLDRVGLSCFADTVRYGAPTLEKRADEFRLLKYLSTLEADGETDVAQSLTHYARTARRPGLAVIISDFLTGGRPESGLQALRARGFDVMALQILDRAELRPRVRGSVRLVDGETGEEEDLAVDRRTAREYRANLDQYSDELSRFCRSAGMEFLRLTTEIPVDEALLRQMRGGLFIR